jgi:hypothetical protein
VLKWPRARVRNHYSAVTKGLRHPVTFAPHVAHDVCMVSPEKVRPLRTITATTVVILWPSPLRSKDSPPHGSSQELKKTDPLMV